MKVSEAKTRVQSKFEGGNSLSVDWYTLFKEAGEALREQINPASLFRTAAVSGTFADKVTTMTCPADAGINSKIIDNNDLTQVWVYTDPNSFDQKQEDGKFTIEEKNGVRSLKVRHEASTDSLTFAYYSEFLFKDKDDATWKADADHEDDIINLGTREAAILVYEACRLVSYSSTKQKGKAKENFVQELALKYQTYWSNTPSLEQPVSYDGSPDISKQFLL